MFNDRYQRVTNITIKIYYNNILNHWDEISGKGLLFG